MLKFIIGLSLIFISSLLAAQTPVLIYIDQEPVRKKIFRDSLEQSIWVNEQLVRMWSQGYLFCELDSANEVGIFFHKGKKYIHRRSTVSIESEESLQPAFEKGSPLKLLKSYTGNGYPFARVQLDSVNPNFKSYHAYYTLEPGPYVVFDSIALLSPIGTNVSYLENALELNRGTPFSEKAYQEISQNIRRIPFLNLKKDPDIAFEDEKATIFLDLRQKPTSSFEGVLGFLPGQSADEGLVITGYVDLGLTNLFQAGIELGLVWNRFANQSQMVDLDYHHPYFLSSKLFLDIGLDLLKQDTTFLTRSWVLGSGIFLTNQLMLQMEYANIAGSLIDGDLSDLKEGLADYKTNLYSLSIGSSTYTKPMAFGRDFRFRTRLSAGEKDILSNSAIDSEAYDSVQVNSVMIRGEAGVRYQLALAKRATAYHQISGAFIFNDEILNNEIHRLGGLRSIRGFNENFFFAQHFILSRFELRQYFEEQSFFMLFYDQMFYTNTKRWDSPSGFGMGLNLDTTGGLFTFALAVGSARSIRLDFANVKVHLGYTATF